MSLCFVKTEPFPATEVSGLENTQQVTEFLQQHNISVKKVIWICLYTVYYDRENITFNTVALILIDDDDDDDDDNNNINNNNNNSILV